MERRVGEALDIVIVTVMMALCLQTGCMSMAKNMLEVQKYTSSYRDKNTSQKYTPSEKVYGTYDGSLSRAELILMVQIQDDEMYGPHAFIYGMERVELEPGYEMYDGVVRARLWNLTQGDEPDTAYEMSYDHASHTYRISKKAAAPME